MPSKRPPKKGAPVGRPSKYKREYCEKVIQSMANGMSLAAFCAEIKVGRDTVFHWVQQYPEFGLAVKNAKEASQAWWERLAIIVATGQKNFKDPRTGEMKTLYKNAHPGMIMFMMGRRFPDYYAKKENIIESESNSRKEAIKQMMPEERIAFIAKYQKLIEELAEMDNGE
jgi:hypothetical protein